MWFLLFLILAPFTPNMDLSISHFFFTPGVGFYNNVLFAALYSYGELFGLATGALTSLLFLLSFVRPKWKKWRAGSLAMTLTLVIGAGLITNIGFKGHWGRPRPKQIIEFEGKHHYRPFWKPNFHTGNDPQKSFPSGHAAMGCYFISLIFVGRRYQSRTLYYLGLFLTLFLGGGLMVARVAQGGHFFSDVLASALLMWYVAKGIDRFTWGAFLQRALCLKPDDTYLKLDEEQRV
jgi:lipid A 4'-phosphatase